MGIRFADGAGNHQEDGRGDNLHHLGRAPRGISSVPAIGGGGGGGGGGSGGGGGGSAAIADKSAGPNSEKK